MNTDVDMTYRFLWDEEPTDEQLQALMQEVGEDVRRESEQMERQIKEKLEEEYARVGHGLNPKKLYSSFDD